MNWAMISAIVAIFALIITILIFNYNVKKQLESGKPYFVISNPGIKENSPPYRIQINMQNEGGRPASNFKGKIFFLDKTLDNFPNQIIAFSVGNDIPVNSPTPWYDDPVQLSENIKPMYIVLRVSYDDSLLNKNFNQTFFMKWDGVINGMTSPDFVHVSMDEKLGIEKYLENNKL